MIIGCTSAVLINETFSVGCLILIKPSVLLDFKAYWREREKLSSGHVLHVLLQSDPIVKIDVFMYLTVIQLISLSLKR